MQLNVLPTTLRFARKPESLAEVRAQLREHRERAEPVVITHTHQLSPQEYDHFGRTLLKDRDWLAGHGGTNLNGATRVVRVIAEGRPTLYINPEGGRYARYIAMDATG